MDLSKLLEKKKEPLSDVSKKAKMSVLGDLQSQASAALGDKLKGLKKVTVAAPDKAGLALGLDKAKELTDGPADEAQEDPSEEASETPGQEALEDKPDEELSLDELDQKIQKLEALKQEKLHAQG